METSTTTLSFIDDDLESTLMSNTPAFTTETKSYEADAVRHCTAFISTTIQHRVGDVTVSAFEHRDDERQQHVAAYLHRNTGVKISSDVTDSGEPVLKLRFNGPVPTQITVFGVSLADLLAAGAEAVRSGS